MPIFDVAPFSIRCFDEKGAGGVCQLSRMWENRFLHGSKHESAELLRTLSVGTNLMGLFDALGRLRS